jgi:hypothetical protein
VAARTTVCLTVGTQLTPYLLRCANVSAELRVEWLVLHLALPTAVARHAAAAAAQPTRGLQGEGMKHHTASMRGDK